jgi:hypothetical protein
MLEWNATNLECLLIADDLTGACDAAVHFARRGYRTRVRLDSHGEEVSVLAISAESRHVSAEEVRGVMDELARRLPVGRARILLKKIDSTPRPASSVLSASAPITPSPSSNSAACWRSAGASTWFSTCRFDKQRRSVCATGS